MVASVSIHYFIRHMCRHAAARGSSAFSAASSASSSAAPVFPVVVRPASAEHAAEMERLISQLPLFTLASSLAALPKSPAPAAAIPCFFAPSQARKVTVAVEQRGKDGNGLSDYTAASNI
ncbi:hypothetical protein DAI22_08g132700 [Oryza sativa Japonica Group]|uniref:Uncharacterized protein n=1 Tax=Oryza sativa subsp. japonica TaxID=39947 RepID=Q6Z263_ORYSJ|nr:hypothetical protein DAI22_08g132700 [Oryza sativa Japonica Group]BAD03531.1 hypothetical protein [Oryza sativa Japonica Group]